MIFLTSLQVFLTFLITQRHLEWELLDKIPLKSCNSRALVVFENPFSVRWIGVERIEHLIIAEI